MKERNSNTMELSPCLVSLTWGQILQRALFTQHMSRAHRGEVLNLRSPDQNLGFSVSSEGLSRRTEGCSIQIRGMFEGAI